MQNATINTTSMRVTFIFSPKFSTAVFFCFLPGHFKLNSMLPMPVPPKDTLDYCHARQSVTLLMVKEATQLSSDA